MKIMDCTMRDGANVLGNGFPKDLTVMMLKGLTDLLSKELEVPVLIADSPLTCVVEGTGILLEKPSELEED